MNLTESGSSTIQFVQYIYKNLIYTSILYKYYINIIIWVSFHVSGDL
jgi:hypothetical protein